MFELSTIKIYILKKYTILIQIYLTKILPIYVHDIPNTTKLG